MINYSVLKDISRLKKYPAGTVISSNEDGLVIVLKGEIGLFAEKGGGRELAASIGPGDFFSNETKPVGPDMHSAVALSETIGIPVACSDAAAFIREEQELACELMHAMCERLMRMGADYEAFAGHPWAEAKPQPAVPAVKVPAAKPSAGVPAAAAPAPAAKPSAASTLFPEGHGSYTLKFDPNDRTYLMESEYTCPYCKKVFQALRVRVSRLQVESVDSDMRNRYRGVEPLYFDVVTCPHCLYSAMTDIFKSPDLLKADLSQINALQGKVKIQTGAETDTFTVFAGYYLALLCAPKCFAKHHQVTAKLLAKLSRVYQDCGDEAMEQATSKLALDAYTHIYIHEDSTPELDQQLCLIMGELHLKLGDVKQARDFFFKAKTNREGSPVYRTQAENRLGEIKAM